MSNIVKRLRALQHFDVCYPVPHPTCENAAARIEQLEAALREIATYEIEDGCPCSACQHSALARAALKVGS